MKRQQVKAESPRRSTQESLLQTFTGLAESVLQGSDFQKASARLATELKTVSGALSVSLFITGETGSELRLLSSSDSDSIRSDASLPVDCDPVASFKRSKHRVRLDRTSKHFAHFRDAIFTGTMVDSIRIYPVRFGNEFLGLLVAAFWGTGAGPAEADAADFALSAASKEVSIVLRSCSPGKSKGVLADAYLEVLDRVDSVVFVFDLSTGTIVEANDSFYKSFGYRKSDLRHLTLFDLVFEPAENVKANIKRAAHPGKIHFPSKLYKHKDGSAIEMEVRGTNLSKNQRTYGIVTAVDLTDRRRAEEESGLQRARYQNFIRNSAEGIWRMEFADPIDVSQEQGRIAREIVERGVIAECNQALARMYGYENPEQLIGKRALDFIADLDVYTASKLVFTERNFSTANIETVEKDRQGNIHYFENSYIGETAENRLIRIWGIQRDITEKRRLQEQLRASENRYRNLIEQANDVVLVFNQYGEFVFANHKFFAQTKYTPEELWGKPISSVTHNEDAVRFKEKLEEQFASPDKHLRHTLRLLTRLNEERVIELGLTTLRTADKSTGVLAIGRDVTVEQSVKSALHESEEKYRSLVEHSLLAVLVIQDEVIVYANPTSSDLFETEFNTLHGKTLDAFIHPNDYVQIFEKFAKASLEPNKDVQFSVRAITSNGELKSIEGWAAGITYLGKPAIQVAMVDVTETKKLEEQLIQSQKMESVGQLASGVAHDFNNLLGSIYGAIGILKEKYAPSDPGLRKYIDILDSSARRAAELTSQLLTFSRQRESDVKPMRLNDIVNDAMKILIRSIGKNIKVEYSLDPTLQPIEADPSQVEGVIINLSINSRDAMPAGGTLRIETSHAEFDNDISRRIPDARPGRYACLSVSDTGIGMDDETKRRIFEPFFTTKPIGKGTGLGLSIVYGIVKNHKGFISVYSEPGRGSTFRVYFPTTTKTPIDELPGAQKEIPRGNETILIIDDELTLLDLTKELLQGLGYTVITAEGAVDGINTYRERHHEIDMVILDMLMPEMTGNEVYPVLKGINPDIAVLLATGLSVGEKVDDMIVMGINGVVGKPYSLIDLATHVREVLGSRK